MEIKNKLCPTMVTVAQAYKNLKKNE